MSRVLVTGGTGFIASYCLAALTAAGHEVAATVRRRARVQDLRETAAASGAFGEAVETFEADLLEDAGWADAVRGCDFVLHVASPFGGPDAENEDALISAARDGSLRVLRAARDAGVRRVVMTSSFAAVGYGHEDRAEAFTETDWSRLERPDVAPYIRSKTLAERAAWDFMAAEGEGMELTAINPVGVFGPVLGPDYSSSIDLIRRLLDGSVSRVPQIFFALADVRDVADLHVRAMTASHAAGERFIAAAGEPMSMLEVCDVLRTALGAAAGKVPSQALPDDLVRTLVETSPHLRQIVPNLGKRRRASSSKARQALGWTPRPNEAVIEATARSLLARGLV